MAYQPEDELNPFSPIPTTTLLVTGLAAAGKTTFIRSVADSGFLSTESAPHLAAKNISSMEFGYMTIADDLRLCLYGTSGQKRFDFMREILMQGMIGTLFIVDSADPSTLKQAREMIDAFSARSPYAVVANKQDLPSTLSSEDLRAALGLPGSIPILPCVALESSVVKKVLLEIMNRLQK